MPMTPRYRRLRQTSILHHPDPDLEFTVEVDASSTGIGAVLSQRQGNPPKLYPCAFFSRKLNPTEQNYDVGNRELLAMKAAFEEWRHWLEGAKHPFTVLTDHRNLEYLKSAKRLNHRQARWSLFFTRFDFKITYRPGSQNTKADALSRLHESDSQSPDQEPIIPSTIILAPVQWDILTEITEAQVTDPPPAETPRNLTYVPQVLRQRVQLVHSNPSSGHPGIAATLHLLNNKFWWSTLRTDTITFIQNCTVCNTAKSPHQLPAVLLQPLPIPQCPWSHLAIDFVTDLPSSQGHTTILTVVDRFSKACRLIPLPKLPTALETAEALCHNVFRFYGLPEDIVSDRGPQFTSRVWSAFCRQLDINVSLTSGYHPQANGQVERLNQELTRFLRSYCHRNQLDWSHYLLWAEYAQNSLRKPSTGITPFQCVLGFQPPLFPWSGEPSELPAVDSWLQRSEETWNEAHVHLQRAVHRTREQANRHRRANPDYQPGQWVWLSTRDLRLRLPCKKLSPRYVGPFKIIRQITPVSFRLALPAHYRISPTFHVSLLKPAGGPRGEENLDEAGDQRAPPIIIDGQEAYQVREISSPGQTPPVSRGLGGVRSGGTVLGQCWGYPRPFTYHGLSSRPPGQTCPKTSRKTPASFASSRQEPLTGGGLCHEFSLCGSLRSPPEGTISWVLTFTDSISHIPRTCGWLPAQVFHIDSGLYKLFSQSPHCEVLFCHANISERFYCVWFPVYDLDCLLDSDSLPPAYSDSSCTVIWLFWVFAACPDP